MKKTRCVRGFSLVEVILAAALSSIVVFGIFMIFQVGNEQTQLSQTLMTLKDTVRESLYKMAQEIRQSSPGRITIGPGGNTITFSVPDPGSPVSANFQIDWTSAHSITYALGGTGGRQLVRTDNTSGLSSVIADNITGVQFTGNAAQPNVIAITLSAQRTLISGRQIPAVPLRMTAQAEVRNS
ncbi:MAG: hypothetical protein BWY42_00640 [Candidatus Omnitrophica bacterium ADurb.Bin277]|nr:MAG: hypothetical protein BWY42_00640 [Candidatus Omnitrophica bacterium ADurb.Bin277]